MISTSDSLTSVRYFTGTVSLSKNERQQLLIRNKQGMAKTQDKIYEGQWEDGEPCGKGKLTNANGDVYEGKFRDGHPHGQGRKVWRSGDTYDGEFKYGMREGKGTQQWAESRDVYEGNWADDLPHGEGSLHFSLAPPATPSSRHRPSVPSSVVQSQGVEQCFIFLGSWRRGSVHGAGKLLLLPIRELVIEGCWPLAKAKTRDFAK